MTTIEDLLRSLDPAGARQLPSHDSIIGRHIFTEAQRRAVPPTLQLPPQPKGGHRYRPLLAVSAAAAVVLAVIFAVTTRPGPTHSASAAQTVLLDLAERAANMPTSLGPGQYAYSEMTLPDEVGMMPIATPGGTTQFPEYLDATVQTWVASDGSGRRVTTVDPTPQFFTSAGRSAWLAAGSPPAPPPPGNQLQTVQTFGPGAAGQANSALHIYDVSGLTTNVNTLYGLLASSGSNTPAAGHLPAGIASLDAVPSCVTHACVAFARASALLQGPSIGMTSALRSALFKVLAQIPGAQALGTTSVRGSAPGLGISFEVHHAARTETATCSSNGQIDIRPGRAGTGGGVTYQAPSFTTTETVVINPDNLQLEAIAQDTRPVALPVPPNPCPSAAPQIINQVGHTFPTWTVLTASGVVNSETTSPSTHS